MSGYRRLTNNSADEYDPEYDFCIGCKYFGEPNGCNRPNGACSNYERFIETYSRLAELEDKIENGMLVELPCNCKIGDLVYGVADFLSKPKLGILTCVEITKYCIQYGIVDKRLMRHDVKYVYYPAEKEAAEAKLKELQEAKNERV